MPVLSTEPHVEMTVEELARRVGAVPLWRVRTDPLPGTATEEDVERIRAVEKQSCELIDGVLVEKVMSDDSSFIAMELGRLLGNFVLPRRIGWVFGPDGFVWVSEEHLRAADVSFVRKNQRPDGLKSKGYSRGAPALAVEILSPGNTTREIEQKRAEFFAAGTELYWVVDPVQKTVSVYADPQKCEVLGPGDLLTGGVVLPGFEVKVSDLFAAADLK